MLIMLYICAPSMAAWLTHAGLSHIYSKSLVDILNCSNAVHAWTKFKSSLSFPTLISCNAAFREDLYNYELLQTLYIVHSEV